MRGTVLSVVNQGGEPHTFTEVAKFGGGFVGDLNHGEATVPECDGGFSNLNVARVGAASTAAFEAAPAAVGRDQAARERRTSEAITFSAIGVNMYVLTLFMSMASLGTISPLCARERSSLSAPSRSSVSIS